MQKKKKSRAKTKSIQRVDIVVRSESSIVPTTKDLAEPIRDGKKMTIPQTWMSQQQLIYMVDKTPKQFVYRRKGKGGQTFDYVTGAYVQKVLNYVFGWNWDFEIVAHGREDNFIWVQGKLTVRGTKPGQQIVKTQFGRAEVKYLKGTKTMLDFGNDLKAATTDSLKKCASLLGIAGDIYGKMEYKDESGQEPKDNGNGPAPALPAPAIEVIACEGATKNGCPTGDGVTPTQKQFTQKLTGRTLCKECYGEFTKNKKK